MSNSKKIIPVIIAVIKHKSKYILTKRVHSDSRFHDKWQFPGGELEFGETFLECLHREVREELNLKIRNPVPIPYIYEARRHDWHGILISFLCSMAEDNPNIKLDAEASEYAWMSKKEIMNLKNTLSGLSE